MCNVFLSYLPLPHHLLLFSSPFIADFLPPSLPAIVPLLQSCHFIIILLGLDSEYEQKHVILSVAYLALHDDLQLIWTF
jgi:hypothetical protein